MFVKVTVKEISGRRCTITLYYSAMKLHITGAYLEGGRTGDPPPKLSKHWHENLKFGQLTLGKIIKIVATRCQILRLKCTKFNFGWGSAPDPARGA